MPIDAGDCKWLAFRPKNTRTAMRGVAREQFPWRSGELCESALRFQDAENGGLTAASPLSPWWREFATRS